MVKKLFVAGLPFSVTDAQLEEYFSSVGKVLSAKVINDRDTGKSKGFGFVEMETEDQAKAAMDQLDGTSLEGRSIVVKEARPMENRNSGGGGGSYDRNRRNRY